MEAIVLNRRDFREFDQLISFYTKEQGKIELLARGVKKIISKNSAHLEPFSYLQIEKVQGKEIDYLINVIPINFFAKIRQKIDKNLAAGFLVSFLEKITENNEPDKRIFNSFLSWLKFIDKTEEFKPILIDGYIMVLLSLLGYKPILENCVICGKDFQDVIKERLSGKEERTLGFYFSGGGIICPDCREKREYIGEQIVNCGLKEVSALQVLLKGDWRLINEFDLEPQEEKALHKLIYEFVLFHSEKKINDWNIIMKLET